MGKIIFYVASSIDGYLADENGGVDWLTPFQNVPYDYGYAKFLNSIGHVITGSKTYEQAKEFPGGWNFPGTHTYVFSSRKVDIGDRNNIEHWQGSVAELAALLQGEKKDTWLLGGAHLAGQFFNENLVDELILSIMPVVLGKGKPLFDGIEQHLPLELISSENFPNGVMQLTYRPTANSQ